MVAVNENVLKLLKEKEYFNENYGEKTWDDIALRVSKGIAKAEKDPVKREEVEQQIYDALSNQEFIFSTPVLLNADENSEDTQLSSCFVLDTKDNIEAICKTDAQLAKIFQKNGGAGLNLSVLRPVKAKVNNSKGYSCGVIGFMEKFDATADLMTRNNPSRKGAIKINISDFHPDLYDFIKVKSDLSKLHRMNISVSLSDKFMEAVEYDEDWNLRFPDYEICKDAYDKEWDGNIEKWEKKGYPVRIYQTVKAKQILKDIAEASWKVAEPGLNFSTTMQKANPNPHVSEEVETNP